MTDENRVVVLFNPSSIRRVGDFTVPMGLLMVAINLYEKYRVVIIDQVVEKDWKSHLSALLAEGPVCLGITAMTGRQIQEGLSAAAMARSKGCPVVWGGTHPSLLPVQTLSHPLVDYVVQGEGETSFAELVEALASGAKQVKGIAGVWSTVDGEAMFGGEREFADLDTLGAVPYHLLDIEAYIKPGGYGRALSLYTSRGCPQQCTFCYNPAIHKRRWRGFSAERVLADIKRLQKEFRVEHFQFWDDSFFASLRRARAIAEGIMELGPAVTWSALGAHVSEIKRMDDDYLECLAKSNLKDVVVGVESGSQRIIEKIKKNFLLDELYYANKRLGQYNIRPTYTFISGMPGEEEQDLKETIQVLIRLKEDNPQAVQGNVKPYVPYPGTKLYEQGMELGFCPPDSLQDWGRLVFLNYSDLDIPWTPRKRRTLLKHLYYYTVLLNPVYLFIDSKLFTFVAHLLRPVALWRIKRFCFFFPIESWLMQIVQRLLV